MLLEVVMKLSMYFIIFLSFFTRVCTFNLISYYANIAYFSTPNSTNHVIGVFLLIWNCLNIVIHKEIFSLDHTPLFNIKKHPKCCLYLFLFRGIFLFIALIIQLFQNVFIFGNSYSSWVGIPFISSVGVTVVTLILFVNHILTLRLLHSIGEPH